MVLQCLNLIILLRYFPLVLLQLLVQTLVLLPHLAVDLLGPDDLRVHLLLALVVEGEELRGFGVELIFCLGIK